ncbi:MAG: 2-phosphosulfolactate phosphatase [Chloroflexota bacterium]|nr:MAG: 2-phosphosulfolactate phosphatase [Chloroflexota bacterium]
MIFFRVNLETCKNAVGAVIVIDVLRAFSTAAYAFSLGAEDILLVSSVEEAFQLKNINPELLLMGEVDGLPIPGFDFGNSPPQFEGLNLAGKHLIQRTTSGTQGVVRSQKADLLYAASFCNAFATAQQIASLSTPEVTFVITGLRPGGWGDEDLACADYLEALIKGKKPDPANYLQRVKASLTGKMFQDPKLPDFSIQDLDYCLAVNQFNFCMPIYRSDGHLLMNAADL